MKTKLSFNFINNLRQKDSTTFFRKKLLFRGASSLEKPKHLILKYKTIK